jgi:hypothetical protein
VIIRTNIIAWNVPNPASGAQRGNFFLPASYVFDVRHRLSDIGQASRIFGPFRSTLPESGIQN